MIIMRQLRLWFFATILMSGISLSVQAQLSKGHFFLTFEDKNVPVENVEQHFGEWFSLPSGTEWRLASSSTDDLGMGRLEYVQYVDGIEVEHSQILLHTKDGKVCTANGTVMEADNAPAESRKAECRSLVFKDSTPTDAIGRTLYLVATGNGYRYAYKVLSADRTEWLYYDAETEQKLKAVPTRHHATKPEGTTATVTAQSLYNGTVPLDVTRTADGKTWLYDQKRNIHTLLASYIPTWEIMANAGFIFNYFPQGNMPDNFLSATDQQKEDWFGFINQQIKAKKLDNLDKYLLDFSSYLGDDGKSYGAYKMKNLVIKKLNVSNGYGGYKPFELPGYFKLIFRYGTEYPNATVGCIEDMPINFTGLPVTFDMSDYHEVIPRDGITVDLIEIEPFTGAATENSSSFQFTMKPKDSDKGVFTYESNGISVEIEYEPSIDPAVDIHWGMERTLDFYKEVFNRNSYDGKGAPVYNLVYVDNVEERSLYSVDNYNAMAITEIPPYPMVYGMGGFSELTNGMFTKPVVELTVMSHEFTHLVSKATANLEYLGESGAIDEAFSDMMGITVKKYVKGNNTDWYIGGDGMLIGKLKNMRDMAKPQNSGPDIERGLPDFYDGLFWLDPKDISSDYGGVHTNLGVGDKWYFLITDGEAYINDKDIEYNVKGIGIEKARQIAYRAMTVYATRQTKYADFRKATLQATKDLYGANGPEVKTVADAWDAVGVYENGVGPNAITNVISDMETDDHYYDLQGRPVSQPGKGIYIYKGKKQIKY